MAIFHCSKTPVLILSVFLLFAFFSSCSGEKKENGAEKEEVITLSGDREAMPVVKRENLTGGAKIYSENCKVCHGEDGKKQLAGAKDLSVSPLTLEQRIEQITNGKTSGKTVMPGYKGLLTGDQIKEVAVYIDSLKK